MINNEREAERARKSEIGSIASFQLTRALFLKGHTHILNFLGNSVLLPIDTLTSLSLLEFRV